MRPSCLALRGLLLAASLLLIYPPAFAATFAVDSTVDVTDASPGDAVCDTGAGACTLRAAIQEANALAGADEITLPAGTYTLAIVGGSEDGAAAGDLDIGTELVLAGEGSATTIIDGGALDRVFDFRSHVALFSTEISGVTIRNGSAPGTGDQGYGGGLALRPVSSSRAVTVTLTDVVVESNTALANGCGAYVAPYSSLTVVDSVVQDHDCASISGGGIHNRGSLTIRSSTLQRNVGSSGGAVYTFASGVTVIESCLVTDNSAKGGGGFYTGSSSSQLWISDSTISSNSATDVNTGFGGAGYLSGLSTVERTAIFGNTATRLGGAFFGYGSLSVIDSTIRGNSAEGGSGGLHHSPEFNGDVVQFRNSTISGNSAPVFSGGLYLVKSPSTSAQIIFNNATIAGNEHTTAAAGSNLYLDSYAQVTMSNTIIAGGIGGVNCVIGSNASLTSAGYNLEDGTSCGLAGTGDQSSATPNLGALADNGGPTQTHALLAGSDAIDAGDPANPGTCESADQRGAPRPIDGDGDMTARCDVGAYEIAPTADLGIAKDDGLLTVIPGTETVYTIEVDNAGPDDASGATVTDVLDPGVFDVASASWTCTPGLGSGMGTDCPASGTGAEIGAGISVDLEAGDSLTIELSAPVLADATGTADNTATVSGGAFDTNQANNSATDSNTLTPGADLSITKDDGVTEAVPGGQVVYTITAANAGASDIPGATVNDSFPAVLTCTSTCAGSAGGSCAPGPFLGDLSETVDLPVGGSVVFTSICSIDISATGSLVNTATVYAPSGTWDPHLGNNSATDTNTLLGPCGFPNHLILANDPIDGIESYTACLTITVGPDVLVAPAASLSLRAGASVILLDDVGVATGGSVTVEIDAGLLTP